MGIERTWTDEEIEVLTESWGNVSVSGIAKKLNRSENAILNKVTRLNLGKFLDCNKNGRVTMFTLLNTLGYNGSGSYKYISWIKNRGLPVHTQVRNKAKFRMVDIDEFWAWAEKNQSFLDFSNFEKNALGKEPEWVDAKRSRDILKQNAWKVKNVKWTKHEDDYLTALLKEHRYTYAELSEKLHRTCGAILRRAVDLGLKERPVRRNPHEKWSEAQLKMLRLMIDNGNNYQEMQNKIDKSEKAIRGKVYVLYGSENLDKVREKLK